MATIKDVAKLAGVGVGTVSRFLSGNASISKEASNKVRHAMSVLNYRPNSIARSLSSKKSNIIGLWVPSFSGSFHRKMLQTIERELRKRDKHIILANAEDSANDAERIACLDYLIERDCDGILMSCPEMSVVELAKIEARYPKIVFINREIPELQEKSFYANHYLGGQLAAKHLIELGHERIAVVCGRMGAQDAQMRHQGFIDVLKEHGITLDDNLIESGGYSFEKGYEATERIVSKGIPFSAIFCGNDNSAMAAISVLQKSGIKVGEDISVIGYDDIDLAMYTSPSLTSVHLPLEEISKNACHQILNLCYGETNPVTSGFEPSLTVRESTKISK
ncbi:LacI family DNA-binding transcriptional regulator [Vibrio sp. ZSDE26]|uniref:LacI family DNA-binding transcriptional regulator n=1 Tax=Vibrio amylolyticus TaxID=2847292 RepID=A0A9X1XKJ5_9VIBR|nr:LacI family DNA-binding transcriptional regulator [Vibrio amylolyticus]MCK6263398.1 LacI family DNA-binding transcriptional regulator [Vibrio amylolyticus]